MNRIKGFVVLVAVFFSSVVFAQKGRDDTDKTDPLFASAFKKYEEGNFQGAYADYTAYLTKFPNDENAMYNRGLCAYELEDYKDALFQHSKSIAAGRKKYDGYYSRGLANYQLNNYKTAILDFDTALSLNPTYTKALTYKGASLNELKRYNEALSVLNEAVATDKNSENVFYNC